MVEVDAGEPVVDSDALRAAIGGTGGFAAVLVKYLSHDHDAVVTFLSTPATALPPDASVWSIIWGYIILLPILVILGAIIGWVSYERHRVKLFLLGVSAPALITTLPTANLGQSKHSWNLISPNSANAQPITKDLNAVFPPADNKYAIYMGSYTKPEYYNGIVNAINEKANGLYAFTTDFTDRDGTAFKRLFVVEKFTLKEALDIRERLLRSRVVDEAVITASLTNIPAK